MDNRRTGYLVLALLCFVVLIFIYTAPLFLTMEKSYISETVTHNGKQEKQLNDRLSARIIYISQSKFPNPDKVEIVIKDKKNNITVRNTYIINNEETIHINQNNITVKYLVTDNNKSYVRYTYPYKYKESKFRLFLRNNLLYIFAISSAIVMLYLLITAIQLLYFE